MIRPLLLVIIASAVSACSQPPEKQIVADAASALGGRSRILAVKTLTIEGEGTNGNLGQDMTMEAASQQFVVSGYKRLVDVVNLRARTADANAELCVLPGAAGAEAGAGRRRRCRLHHRAQR